MLHTRNVRPGYSMIELLVCIGILALLIGLILGAIQKVRMRAARASDENNLRQIGLATQNYEAQHGRLPPLIDMKSYAAPFPGQGSTVSHWAVPTAVFLVPFLDGPPVASLYSGLVEEASIHKLVISAYTSIRDDSHVAGRLDRFRLPVYNGDDLCGVGNYAFNVWAFGGPAAVIGGPKLPLGGVAWMMNDRRMTFGNGFPDGASQTLLLATKKGRCGDKGGGSLFASARYTGFDFPISEYVEQQTSAAFFGHRLPTSDGIGPTFQTLPDEANCDGNLAQGFERGLISVGMADGSVRAVSKGINAKQWRSGLLPDDGDSIREP